MTSRNPTAALVFRRLHEEGLLIRVMLGSGV